MVRSAETTLEQRRVLLRGIFERRGLANLTDRIEAAVVAFSDEAESSRTDGCTRPLPYPVHTLPTKLAV
jgi:hypothetical protein